VEAIPLPVRVENAINASVGYVIKSVWPHNLAVFYPHRGEQIPTWQTLASLAALALMTVAAIRVLRRAPYIAVGWFWFLGTLVPVLGLVQVGAQAMADRYMYLPQIGLCMIVAWGFRELWVGWKYRFVLLGSIGLTVCIAFAWLSYEQIGYWKNTVTLFEHTLKVSEKNWVAHHNLGTAYLRANEYRRAADQFARTLEIYPMIASTHNNLGKALIALGRPDSARIHFQDAIRHDPRLTDAYVNLGMLELENGNWSEAIRFFREAVGINPRDANAHFNLAITLSKIGQAAEALSHLATVLEIDPRDEEARREYDRVRAGQFK
jgi:tetratricopeptide (TPR) repeat protein